MTNPAAGGQVSVSQIADLLAWARSLSDAGASAEADQRAAYQAAKAALLARITDQPTTPPDQGTPRD